MAVGTFTLFFALLAGFAVVVAGAIAFSAIFGDRLGVIEGLRPVALELAAAVATTAMLGSLYLSEIAGFEPCRLCWVQRAFMYPAALMLLIALALRSRVAASGGTSTGGRSAVRGLTVAAGVLATIGLPVSVFHRYEQAVGSVGEFCDLANPCSQRWIEHFGFVTTPVMAGAGFAAVIALCGIAVTGAGRTTVTAELNQDDGIMAEDYKEYH